MLLLTNYKAKRQLVFVSWLLRRGLFWTQQKELSFLWKSVLGIFDIARPNRHVFYMTITGNFELFQYFFFETSFLEKENLFWKTGVNFLSWKSTVERVAFPYKTSCQKPILRQTEWGVENGRITKNAVLHLMPVLPLIWV